MLIYMNEGLSLKTFTSIEELMAELESFNYNYYALRNPHEQDFKIIDSGRDYLDCSYVWEDGECTDEELPGTCGIFISDDMSESEILRRYRMCRNDYNIDCKDKPILLIGGKDSEWGTDEDEIIVGTNGYGADVVGYVKL